MKIWFKSILIAILICSCNETQTEQFRAASGDSLTTEKASIDASRQPAFLEISEPQVDIDLAEIKKRGRLIALTGYNANSYFIYKGEPLGFEYELLKLLADDLGLELEIVIARNLDEIFNLLNQGKCDIVAYNLTITKKRMEKVSFTDYHTLVRQVLVQRLPDRWLDLKRHEIEKMIITNPVDLIGKRVYVRKGSSYYARLVNLCDEIGGDIEINEAAGDVSTEELIRRVARGEIEYTVADDNLALINVAYYANIDIHTPLSLPQRIGWAVRKNSPHLREAVNRWLKKIKIEPTYNVLYDKYYLNKRFFSQRVKSEFFSMGGNKISPYDDFIKEHARQLNWDWRLLASQVYQESQFDPQAKSWAGAQGLMQLMPLTAKEVGVKNPHDPRQNLAGGVKYLARLWEYWRAIPDSTERLKFALASYNAGPGHLEDARRLAQKFNKDPNRWENNVAELLLKKADEKYFQDEVVQFGYCRGEEPVNYVAEILERYRDYQKFIEL